MSVAIDRLSFVASPNGFLTAARAATALECAVTEAAASRLSPGVGRDDAPGDGKGPPMRAARTARPLAPLLLRPSVSTSLQVQIGEFRSLLSLESRPLASLSMSGLSFEASRSEWWDVSGIKDVAFQTSGWKDATRDAWVSSSAPPFDKEEEEENRRRGHHYSPPRRREQVLAGTARERSMPLAGWPGWTWTGGRRRADLGFLRVSLQGLGVLDLTTDGQLHTEVVSLARARGAADSGVYASGATSAPPRRSSSSRSSRGQEAASRSWVKAAGSAGTTADQAPVVVVELIPASSGGGGGAGREVKASVCGLRVCFLRRFMAEVIKYFGPDGLGPVFDVVRRIGRDGLDDGADGGETKDQEEEEVVVVVGEEDERIPDTWSVASSVDRRRSGSRRERATVAAASPAKQMGSAAAPAESRSENKAPGAEASMLVTAVLRDLTVVIPRNTHSREAVAVKCDELVVEVSRASYIQ